MNKDMDFMRDMYKKEKFERQNLQTTKYKQMLLGELVQCSAKIEERVFLDEKREQRREFHTSGNLMTQVIQ